MLITKQKQPAFMLTELIVAISVLTGLVIALALTLDGFKRFNHYQWTRQRCLAAAQAQLDGFSVGQQPLDANTIEQLWPGISTTVEMAAGTADWQGLTLVTAQAQAPSYQRQVQVRLARYIKRQSSSETGL
ncbi:hypothetical protein ACFL6U_29715 [Planctomycetota bacterium]